MAHSFTAGVSATALSDLQRLSFAIAYRMLGSVADAEDIVQEAQLRLHRAQEEGTAIESPRAYLAAVTTRLAIDQLRSARLHVVVGADGQGFELLLRPDDVFQSGAELCGQASVSDNDDADHLELSILRGDWAAARPLSQVAVALSEAAHDD